MKRAPVAFSSVQLCLMALLASPRFFTRPQLLSRIGPPWGGDISPTHHWQSTSEDSVGGSAMNVRRQCSS